MSLDIAPLSRAVDRLQEGLRLYRADPAQDIVRDGLIQRFEFTYEMAHGTLRRFLRQAAADPGAVDRMTFQDLIRSANALGVLRGEWAAWRRFRDMRARTSHTYDPRIALDVVAQIPDFLAEAEHLRAELGRRLA